MPTAPVSSALGDLVRAGVPGAVALVRNNGKTVVLASGYSDRARHTRMRASARFRVGTVTNTFVAAVVLQLVAERRLSLDEPVVRIVPGLLPPSYASVTIHELLQQTSGLYDYMADARWYGPYGAHRLAFRPAPRRLLALAVSHPPVAAPGVRYLPSATNYLALALVVESVTRHPLGFELARRIFGPLGLRHTSFGASAGAGLAHGYTRTGAGLLDVSRLSPSADWPAGALVSDAQDVAHFYRALLGGRLIRRDLLRKMKSIVWFERITYDGYGLGLQVTKSLWIAKHLRPLCRPAWGHTGYRPGYLTTAYSSLDGRRQFVILVNEDDFSLPWQAPSAISDAARAAYCG
ncbi:MAG: serine hydrolase domain-containing protein [Gaiellaceae bacterium]